MVLENRVDIPTCKFLVGSPSDAADDLNDFLVKLEVLFLSHGIDTTDSVSALKLNPDSSETILTIFNWLPKLILLLQKLNKKIN